MKIHEYANELINIYEQFINVYLAHFVNLYWTLSGLRVHHLVFTYLHIWISHCRVMSILLIGTNIFLFTLNIVCDINKLLLLPS